MAEKDKRFTFSPAVEEEVRRIWWEESERKDKGLKGPKPVPMERKTDGESET